MARAPQLATLFGVDNSLQASPDLAERQSNTRAGASPPHGPNDPPWGSGIALAVWIVSVLLIVIVPSIFLAPYALMQNPPLLDNAQLVEFAKSDKTAILLQVLAVIPAHVITLLLGWIVVTQFRKYPFREMLGWNSGGMKWWHHIVILVFFGVVAAVVSSYFPEQENDLTRMLRSSQAVVFVVAFLATFTAPLVEELVYRGILFSAFQRTMGVFAAFIAVTSLFAIIHVPQYYPSWSTIGLLFLLSFILTGIRIYTKNLWPCIVLHTLFNGIQSVGLVIAAIYPNAENTAAPAFLLHIFK